MATRVRNGVRPSSNFRPDRRRVITSAGAALASLATFPLLPSPGLASELELPALDRLSLSVILDDAASVGSRVRRSADLIIDEIGGTASDRRSRSELVYEPTLSLHARTFRAAEMRNILFDFGCSPAALSNNMARLRIDPSTIDQVVSREHMPQLGRLPRMGRRWTPTVSVADHGFSPVMAAAPAKGGAQSSVVKSAGDQRDANDQCTLTPSDITVSFLLLCRGLVIVTSYRPGHLLDAIRAAQATSGVTDIHAVVIAVDPSQRSQPVDVRDDLAAVALLSPDYVVIGRGSGKPLFEAAEEMMPGRTISTKLGMRLSFVV